MSNTKIEWTDFTWNPITGCTKISPGCAHCYAETMALRLCAMGIRKYCNGFNVSMHEEALTEPLALKRPHTIFVCSMSDLFHESVPTRFISKVMSTIVATPQHRYQILTKRAERMRHYFSSHSVPSNVWLGVTVECKSSKSRIDSLRAIKGEGVRFLSCEPLIEDLGDIDLRNIDWIIVGGESGWQARPMRKQWVIDIKNQADKRGVAFFFKQWGTWGSDGIKRSKHENGKELCGKIYSALPL